MCMHQCALKLGLNIMMQVSVRQNIQNDKTCWSMGDSLHPSDRVLGSASQEQCPLSSTMADQPVTELEGLRLQIILERASTSHTFCSCKQQRMQTWCAGPPKHAAGAQQSRDRSTPIFCSWHRSPGGDLGWAERSAGLCH